VDPKVRVAGTGGAGRGQRGIGEFQPG
jgi:hypothetical protein